MNIIPKFANKYQKPIGMLHMRIVPTSKVRNDSNNVVMAFPKRRTIRDNVVLKEKCVKSLKSACESTNKSGMPTRMPLGCNFITHRGIALEIDRLRQRRCLRCPVVSPWRMQLTL